MSDAGTMRSLPTVAHSNMSERSIEIVQSILDGTLGRSVQTCSHVAWGDVWLPTRIAMDAAPEAVLLGESVREVSEALGRPLAFASVFAEGDDRPTGVWRVRPASARLIEAVRGSNRRAVPVTTAPMYEVQVASKDSPISGYAPVYSAVVGHGRNGLVFGVGLDRGLRRVIEQVFQVAPGAQLSERYMWSARFLCANGSIKLHCDPRGALDLFRSRDTMPGQRRRSLLHFVRGHRRRTTAGETLAEVKRHLRGIRSFVWNDWQVQLVESEFDRESLS